MLHLTEFELDFNIIKNSAVDSLKKIYYTIKLKKTFLMGQKPKSIMIIV